MKLVVDQNTRRLVETLRRFALLAAARREPPPAQVPVRSGKDKR